MGRQKDVYACRRGDLRLRNTAQCGSPVGRAIALPEPAIPLIIMYVR